MKSLIILKNKFYFIVNIITFFLITVTTLSAADDSLDLDQRINFKSFSSEVNIESIGRNISDIVSTAQSSIIIASDKCTYVEFLDTILKLSNQTPNLTTSIVIGDDEQKKSILWDEKYQSFTRNSISKNQYGGKMHNKFIIVDNRIVITGSPNLTKAAYNSNIESFVSMENQRIGELYRSYYEYIIDQTERKKEIVLNLMTSWNSYQKISTQICLAPLASIKEFIIKEINSAKIVKINMYLISRATQPDGDIVSYLAELGEKVTVKVSKNEYDKQEYMKVAINELIDNGVHVFTVAKFKPKGIFHDKLILIEYENDIKKVVIGSAGFTTNVQDNLSFENMVSINHDPTYNFLLSHFDSITSSRKTGRVKVKELK